LTTDDTEKNTDLFSKVIRAIIHELRGIRGKTDAGRSFGKVPPGDLWVSNEN